MAAAGATLALLGCAVGPDFKRPEAPATKDYVAGGVEQPKVTAGKEAPQQFTMGKKISGDWWHLFRSPPLDDVLKTALAQNQSLAAAVATLAQAQQGITQAGGALFPQVDFAASASRERVSLASVKRITTTMALFVAEWCGTERKAG